MNRKVPCTIVGCGHIAGIYAKEIQASRSLQLAGFFDLDPSRAEALAENYGGKVYQSLEAVLADEEVPLIINLTIHHVHAEIIEKCLLAGKHVHTEKPMASTAAEARKLADLAAEKGLQLSSAPSTFLGEAQQKVREILQSNRAGKIRLAYAEINHGRIETWHANPEPFYEVGVLWDVGIYPVTLLTSLFGPVGSVQASADLVMPERKKKDGTPFTIGTPDFILAVLRFDCGLTARLSCNFYAKESPQGSSVEFHGDDGTILLGSSFIFNETVQFGAYGEKPEPVAIEDDPYQGIEFSRGAQRLGQALLDGQAHAIDTYHPVHVVEVLEAIDKSVASGAPVAVDSSFRK